MKSKIMASSLVLFILILGFQVEARTDAETARMLLQRLTGTKSSFSDPRIAQMAALISQNKSLEAAAIATDDPNFYNVTVKLMALKMSTKEETSLLRLNDFAASFIGVTRDQRDARELLTGNFYYRGDTGITVARSADRDLFLSNNHYEDLDTNKINLVTGLVRVDQQSIINDLNQKVMNPDPAGVLTSRAFIGAHANSGTNRRLVEYTLREFLCTPLSEAADNLASDSHIGRDVDRFPGGDHARYESSCKSCHTIMDGFRGAFAKVDFKGLGIVMAGVNQASPTARGPLVADVDRNGVMQKYSKNSDVFPDGFVTRDNSFVNNAIRPRNADLFGWRGAQSGAGIKEFGALVANSRRFSQCMAKRAFESVCNKSLDASTNKALLESWGNQFESMNYDLKKLFQFVAVQGQCL